MSAPCPSSALQVALLSWSSEGAFFGTGGRSEGGVGLGALWVSSPFFGSELAASVSFLAVFSSTIKLLLIVNRKTILTQNFFCNKSRFCTNINISVDTKGFRLNSHPKYSLLHQYIAVMLTKKTVCANLPCKA